MIAGKKQVSILTLCLKWRFNFKGHVVTHLCHDLPSYLRSNKL